MSNGNSIEFMGTPAQEAELKKVIAKYKNQPGGLMPALQEAQGIYGYLPYEVQKMLAEGMDVSMSEVFGVATFYAQFSLVPKGKYIISVCLGTACYVKGADKVLTAIEEKLGIKSGECTPDRKFSIEACRCVGACGLAPVLLVNEDVYGRLGTDDVAGVLEKYAG